jgi:hypothetical protein
MKGHKGHHHGHKHHRDEGGRVGLKAAGNPDVFKEAEEKTSGNTEERKHGGKVKKKHLGHAEGKMAKHRRDRAHGGKAHHGHHHRAKGGRVGADKSPLSSAHHGGKAEERAGGQPD